MSIANGSTEVVPCSHLLENLDVALHDKDIYNSFEPYFMNVTLNQVYEVREHQTLIRSSIELEPNYFREIS